MPPSAALVSATCPVVLSTGLIMFAAEAALEYESRKTSVFACRSDFSISASHSNSKLRSTLTSTNATGAVSVVSGIRNGARMPTVPEDQAAAAATWRWPRNAWVGYTTGTYQHIGDRYTQVGDEDLGNPGSQSLTTFAVTVRPASCWRRNVAVKSVSFFAFSMRGKMKFSSSFSW